MGWEGPSRPMPPAPLSRTGGRPAPAWDLHPALPPPGTRPPLQPPLTCTMASVRATAATAEALPVQALGGGEALLSDQCTITLAWGAMQSYLRGEGAGGGGMCAWE